MTVLRDTFSSKATRAAGIVFLVIVAVGVFANVLCPDSPFAQNSHLLAGPSLHHLLGTDYLGRDTLSRLILGTRYSLEGALEAVAIGVIGGVVPGVLSVFIPTWAEFATMRFVDAFMTIPSIVFALGFVAVLGETQAIAMCAIGILFIPQFFRITRAATLRFSRMQYVEVARLQGATRRQVIRTHIWRKVFPTVAVTSASMMANGLLAVSTLAFLGIGAQPPTPTWGGMLSEDLNYLSNAGLSALWPGLVILASVASLSIIADGLRDATGSAAGAGQRRALGPIGTNRRTRRSDPVLITEEVA
jgi:peptide/nickel transport system permease protein